MAEKLRDEFTDDIEKDPEGFNAERHQVLEELRVMHQIFDDIEKDPEGFKAGMHQILGELGTALAQFIVEALTEFPDVMRATPQTAAKQWAEDPSAVRKQQAEFDKKFKTRFSDLFSELPPELRERQLASCRRMISPFHDSDTIERVFQYYNLVAPEDPSEQETGKA